MNIEVREKRGRDLGGLATIEMSAASSSVPAVAPPEETVFSLLASRARTRAPAHLWITAAVGAVDAAALLIAWPSLWWVAAGCIGVTAYAVWGLADRGLNDCGPTGTITMRRALGGVRSIAVVTGVAATAVTVFGFVGAALGRGALGW